jgi:hypothetical protein
MTELKQKYDASTVAVMRQALNEIVTDRRYDVYRTSISPNSIRTNGRIPQQPRKSSEFYSVFTE